jgi:sulfatase maturation enzyme AslB (radical SAM superfamily)
MNVSINPWYYCNFRCDFCYLTPEKLSDKSLLGLDVLAKRLDEIASHSSIDQIDFYGGEIGLLPKKYFQEMKELCQLYRPSGLNIISNLSMINEIVTDSDCSLSVSYDFNAREDNDRVWKNMALLTKPFSVLILASDTLIKNDPNEMIFNLNLLSNITSVEIKPYSTNQANQQGVTFKHFEEFIKQWITSPVEKKFTFVNEYLIQESIDGQRNSFSDDHVYITPSGNYGVLEFDLNDNEFFLEYSSLEEYLEWCEIEKRRVNKNKFCSNCDYFGSCLSEHLREVKNLDNSCNGFKLLMDWYRNYEKSV